MTARSRDFQRALDRFLAFDIDEIQFVVVGLGSDAARWAPLNRRRHRLVSVTVACRPCEHRVCPIHFPCAQELHSGMVIEAARELLNSRLSARPEAFEARRA